MKLYGSVNKRSFNTLKIRAALAEAGADYEFIPVDPAKGEARTPDFLALNPHGKIPVLVDDDGFALAESDAILWYVAEKLPGAKLLPPNDGTPAAIQARAQVLRWCMLASSAFYAAYIEWWNFGHGTDPDKRVAEVADAAVAKVDRAVRVMQTALANRDYLAGAFSIADLSNAAVLQSLKKRLPNDPIANYDRVTAWYARVTARSAWRAAND